MGQKVALFFAPFTSPLGPGIYLSILPDLGKSHAGNIEKEEKGGGQLKAEKGE